MSSVEAGYLERTGRSTTGFVCEPTHGVHLIDV
jgi:hypothetical protein